MILGLFTLPVYTTIHVIISLIAIAAGFVVVYGFVRGSGWTAGLSPSCCSPS